MATKPILAPGPSAVPERSDSSGNRPNVATPLFLILVVLIGVASTLLRTIDLSAVPSGLHFDQAANGLLALEILGGKRPVFFPSYTGREAFFMYIIAALFSVLGPGVLALRLAGALCGVVTVVGVAFLGASLYNRRIGLVAATFLGGLYWHVHISRLGERTITVPMLDVLALLALWEGFRRRSILLVAAGGALVGLQLYTYPSSRFFVILLVSLACLELGAMVVRHLRKSGGGPPDGWTVRRALGLGAIATLAAVVATAPLARHFLASPGEFLSRADQVAVWNMGSTRAEIVQLTLTSTFETLRMFFTVGDQDWKYNLAGQPVFDVITAVFFLLGIVVGLRNLRSRADRLTLLWCLAMLGPGFLSVDAPQFMRTLGAAPAATLLAARGLDVVVRWLTRLVPSCRRLVPLLWIWPVVAGGLTAYHYFGIWGPSAAAYYAEEGDVTAAAGVISSQTQAYAAIYVASRYGPDPTESFLDGDLSRVHWFDGRAALPLPPPGSGPTLYVLPRSAVDRDLYNLLPPGGRVAEVIGPDGAPSVEAFVLMPDPAIATGAAVTARDGSLGINFGGIAHLERANISTVLQAGVATIPTFAWRLNETGGPPLKFYIHLVDSTGETWTQFDDEVYPTNDWRVGQSLLVRPRLDVPQYVPPGQYHLEVGIEHADGSPVSVRASDGQSDGNSWKSPEFNVVRPPRPPDANTLDVGRRLNVAVGDSVRLLGVRLGSPTILAGDSVPITLYWQVVRVPSPDAQTYIAAVDSTGHTVGETIQSPTGGVWPPDQWRPGDVVVDRETLLVPAGTNPGSLNIVAGLEDNPPLRSSSTLPATPTVSIGTLTVAARPQTTQIPVPTHPMVANFDRSIQFLGYDLQPGSARPGETIHLRLFWKTDHAVTQDWTVFTHVLDNQNKVRAQQDGVPSGGRRPTTTWAPGETIVDDHDLIVQADASAGTDQVEIGLYDVTTGERLKTLAGQDRVLLDLPVTISP